MQNQADDDLYPNTACREENLGQDNQLGQGEDAEGRPDIRNMDLILPMLVDKEIVLKGKN